MDGLAQRVLEKYAGVTAKAELQELFDTLLSKKYPGFVIKLMGSYLSIGGDTYPMSAIARAAGGVWARPNG